MLVFYVKVPKMKFHIQFFVVYDTTEDNWENLNLFFFFKSNITINLFKKNPWSLYTKDLVLRGPIKTACHPILPVTSNKKVK